MMGKRESEVHSLICSTEFLQININVAFPYQSAFVFIVKMDKDILAGALCNGTIARIASGNNCVIVS